MAEASRRAARRRVPNILFVQAALETLPAELSGQADRITVNYPWGSLLKAVARPELDLLSRIAALGRPGAEVSLLINMSVFDDAAYCTRLGLPCPPVLADPEAATCSYGLAGLAVTGILPDLEEPPFRTTWGQKLIKGGARRVLQLTARVAGRPDGALS